MNQSEDKQGGLKAAIGKCLIGALSGQNLHYRTSPEGFIRWGRVQDDMNAAIDAAFSSCADTVALAACLKSLESEADGSWTPAAVQALAMAKSCLQGLTLPESGLTLEEADEANARWAQETSTPCPPVPAAPSTPQPEAPTPRTELDFLRHLSDLLCPPNGDMPQVKDALVELSARRMVLSAAQSASSATTPIIGYAVRMENNGAFVGIWRDREMAEHVCAKQPPGHNDVVIPVCEAPRSANAAILN